MPALRLEKQHVDEMIAHAREEDPNECCGVLAGKDGRAVKLYRAANGEKSPYRYNMDPQDLFRIHREIDHNGWELLGIYHSHTHTEAYPSQTDVRLAFYPDSYYIIISLMNPQHPAIRAFRMAENTVTEERVEIIE